MKSIITNRILTLTAVLAFALTANSQTIDIGPNEYAFQFTGDPDFGLFFNATDSRYEFLNSTATPIFGFSAGTGAITTNLSFGASADLLIGNDRYAFRAASNPNFGLFFNSTETEYQLLNNAAVPVFSVNANTGRLDNDLRFNAGKSLRIAPGEFGLRSAALPNAGLLFGTVGYEFRTADGNTAVYIDATTGDMGVGNTNPFSKLHVGGDLRLDGILYAENSLAMAAWDVFADANQYAINETNVATRIQVLPGGNVGLSTDAPTSRLDVNGEARIRELPLDNALDQVVVADADGNLFSRDASTLTSGGASLWSQNGNSAYYNTGRVGIGTNNPGASLQVNSIAQTGSLLQLNNQNAGGTAYQDFYSGTTGHLTVGLVGGGNGEQVGQAIVWNRKNSRLVFGTNDLDRMTIRNNGNVGIGTQTPRTKLDVNGNAYFEGKIFTREVEVTLASFPDYVFKADYDLMSLTEVDAFIQANGHLPNMPTEAEVVENGLNLGEMNVKLVEKVEELTLHLIEKEKQYEALQSRLEMLEKAILNQD